MSISKTFSTPYRRRAADRKQVLRTCSVPAALRAALHGEYKLKILIRHEYIPHFRHMPAAHPASSPLQNTHATHEQNGLPAVRSCVSGHEYAYSASHNPLGILIVVIK
jgi:hypothetical protein